MQLQEKILIIELKRSNARAFELLYLRYSTRLYNYFIKTIHNSQEAEGLVQDVFMAIWENREKLDEDKSFCSFIFKIARNKVLNNIKKQLTQNVYRKYILDRGEDRNDLRMDIESNELMEIIRKSLDALPERTREIFFMNRDEGLTYKEIAERIHSTENIVDHEIRKALQWIKAFLKASYTS